MKNSRAVKQFTRSLNGLQGSIALFPEGFSEFLLTAGYPQCMEELESIRPDLQELGLYDELRDVLTRSEALVREGQYDEAEMLVLDVNRKLSKASGAEADLRRLYTSANDGKA